MADFRLALETLVRHRVEFIVVGGIAAVLEGAPISTFDLDIVHERSETNVDRLLAALAELDARYRDLTGRVLRPEAVALRGPGHHLLQTTAGPIDVLGQLVGDRDFEQLVDRSHEVTLADNASFRVLDLDFLIELKAALGRPKDRAVLATLRETLAARKTC